jgi:uncharacterized protein YecE (DUF72 family)
MTALNDIRWGTCSWKYDAWRGLVYTAAPEIDYLAEYARKYDCVEVDQWFWSLFAADKVALPKRQVVNEYAASVPSHFRFGIKMPNALTLTHFRPATKADPLVANPHFLSKDILAAFLDALAPLQAHLGPMMFQFEYLNRKKMPSQAEFVARLGAFADRLPKGVDWCIETRNPNYLNAEYFRCLREHGLGHVFLQGYYMPPIFETYRQFADALPDTVVIRLHGPDREGMEARTGSDWSRIVEPRDADLDAIADMMRDLRVRRRNVWVFANNHFEGSAPLTLQRLAERMARGG